jgi:asparagine synthase (glutamine-hydrolysing)
MCGFVAIFDTRGERLPDRALLDRMNESQHHRGPDEGGLHLEPGVGLGHRRLSIIDLASGQQPLFNEDQTVVVVYNGEIYNFQTLAAELQALGHRFRTHSDTEVIVHAWEEWGRACVGRFRGMFAFALWDRNRQTLFVARDRLGIKPVHYASLADGQLLVGSELKSLACHPGLEHGLDPLAIEDYCAFGYVPEPRTIYKNVHKLPPGFTLTWCRGDATPVIEQYWDVPLGPAAEAPDESAALEELVARIDEAVRIRLIAEVPLGAFLSGGVDSSTVVAAMTRVGGGAVNTCSIAFGEAEFNEAAYAEQVAQRYRTRHHVDSVDPDDFSLVDRLAALYDEPYADSSAIPTYRVCELARRRVTVALSGDGGDELLAGYRRYGWHLQEDRLRGRVPGVLRQVAGRLGRHYPALTGAPRVLRARATLLGLGRDRVAGYFNIIAVMNDDLRGRLYSQRFRGELQGYTAEEVLRTHARKTAGLDPLSEVQYLDIKTYLPGDILTKVDRASMAHALEVRVPLLDHQLVEWLAGLPPTLKRRGTTGKYLLKKAMEPYLPADILYRPKKGFAVPLVDWFRGPLRERLERALLKGVLVDSGLFEPRALGA